MFREYLATALTAIVVVLTFVGQPSLADWGISFGGEYISPSTYYGDRITSEYRRGYQVDDWVERGASSVTESPIFPDGIRLTAWATLSEEDYEYALASAIYYFEVPPQARSIRIKIYYEGEPDRDDLNNDIAGRVWIRRTRLDAEYEEYYPKEGRYEDIDRPLYGDTFVLPARKHLEIIRIPAEDHVDDGIMELHVVAEGRQRIDVKYIEVETYTYLPTVRVITRYYKDYMWRPWYDYTYWYFYTGPIYYFSDYYYVRYAYPYYPRYYVEIRGRYNNYLRIYYVARPHLHVRWSDVSRVHRGAPRTWDRDRLGKWTPDHDEVRRSYEVTSTKVRRPTEVKVARERIRSVLANSTRRSPSAVQASRSGSVETRGESVPEMKRRREPVELQRQATIEPRTRTDSARSYDRTTPRVETEDQTKVRRETTRSSIRTEPRSENRSERVIIKQTPSRSAEQQKRETRDDTQIKRRREATRPQESKKEEPKLERAPRRESSSQSAPKAPEVKKDDDDDEDKDKNKQGDSSSGSSVRKRIRGR